MTQSTTAKPTTNPASKPDGKQESDASKANRTEPFDFGALTIQDEATRPTRKNTKAADPKQMEVLKDALRKSWEARDTDGFGSGKSVTVPNEYANRTATMIRKAAEALNGEDGFEKTPIGTNISTAKLADGKMTKVTFAAKPRKFYTTQ
jgi:hypothetical protein